MQKVIEGKYIRIQLKASRASQGGDYKPGILAYPTAEEYFYYPHGDYDAAIAKLVEAGFVKGGSTPPSHTFYTDEEGTGEPTPERGATRGEG